MYKNAGTVGRSQIRKALVQSAKTQTLFSRSGICQRLQQKAGVCKVKKTPRGVCHALQVHMSIRSFLLQIIVKCSLCVKRCSGHDDAILNKRVKISFFVQVVSGGQFLNIKCNFKTFCYMEVGFDGTKTRCKETSQGALGLI